MNTVIVASCPMKGSKMCFQKKKHTMHYLPKLGKGFP